MLHTLDWEYTPDYELIGISSSVGCHRLAWALNRHFGWHLACGEDLVVPHAKQADTSHPTMRHSQEEEGVHITVVLNRVSGGMLAKGASGLDFLMAVNHHELAAHEIIAALRTLKEVTFVTVLDPEASGAMEPLMALD